AADVCDVAETCSGTSVTCPSDGKKPSGTACADDGNPCTQDKCDGTNIACQHPAGNAGTVCRPEAPGSNCDVAETCTGTSATCPADGFKPAMTVCRAQSGACDVPESCTGSSATCPTDVSALDGTICNGGNCTQSGSCQAGTCVGTSPVTCTAQDACHSAGTCDPNTGVCSNPPNQSGNTCDDDDALVRGFENIGDWTSSGGNLSATNVVSQGSAALAVSNLSGLTEITSRAVSPPYDFDLGVSYDISVPAAAPTQYWFGGTQ